MEKERTRQSIIVDVFQLMIENFQDLKRVESSLYIKMTEVQDNHEEKKPKSKLSISTLLRMKKARPSIVGHGVDKLSS